MTRVETAIEQLKELDADLQEIGAYVDARVVVNKLTFGWWPDAKGVWKFHAKDDEPGDATPERVERMASSIIPMIRPLRELIMSAIGPRSAT